MKHRTNKIRAWLLSVFTCIFMLALTFGFAACSGEKLKIDVPERIEEDLGTGTYVVPRYDVVSENGVIMAGYTVRLKSVTDPNGEEAEISREASTIVTLSGAGEYTFVYTADSKKVAEATVIMDFADRTAPTITLPASQFPSFFIKNGSYTIPEYSISGDFVASKCYVKVLYSDGQNADEEVELKNGSFVAAKDSGKYTVLVHVEDAAGNYNEYRYTRTVYAPESYDPATVVYFNEELGAKQVSAEESAYSGKYVSVADGGKAYGEEKGSYKVEFNGKETNNNEAYFSIDVPAISNIMSFKELEMYVYIDDSDCPNEKSQWVVGSKWWNDQNVKSGEWTRVTWSVDNWGNGKGANIGATMANVIPNSNITGTRIRLIPDADYNGKTAPHATVYFSAMRAISWEPSIVTAGEHVSLSRPDGKYGIGQQVNLFAEELPGKTFDCFVVDGQPITGDYFYPTKAAHTVEAHYVDGELTADNMLWGTSFTDASTLLPSAQVGFLTSNNITAFTAGASKNWALSFDVTGGFNADEKTNQKFGVSIYFGNTRTFEFQINGSAGNYTGNFKHYGNGNYNQIGQLSSALVQKIVNASEENPVHFDAVRLGDYMYVYVNGEYFYTVTIPGLTMYGDYFGYAWRVESKDVTTQPQIKNAKAVVGEERATLAFERFSPLADITFENEVTAEKESYRIGETVKLIAPAAPEGQKFLHFTVNGQKIDGDTFVVTGDTTVGVVFATPSSVTFSGGAGSDSELVISGTITLKHDNAPEGKFFDCYLVNGTEKVFGNTYTLTAETKTIAAVYATAETMSWQDGTNGKTPAEWGLPEGEVNSHKSNGQTMYVLGASNNWAIRETVYGGYDESKSGARYYFGFMISSCSLLEFQVLSNGNVTIGTSGSSSGWATYLTEKVTDRSIYSTIINATQESPVTFTAIRKEKVVYFYANDELLVKVTPTFSYSNPFGYGSRAVGENIFPTTANRGYTTDTAKVDALIASYVSEIDTENATADKESAVYGETVTLTAAPAEAGMAFSYFTVDGKIIDGNTFMAKLPVHQVKAVYVEITELVLGEGVSTTDGKTTYARGERVRFTFDSSKLNGKVVDYYVVDKDTTNQKIYSGDFVLTAASHTVEAVLVNPSEMTWGNGGTAYNYESVMGTNASEWKARGLDGEVYGQAEYWAISVDAKYGSGWQSFEFIQGTKESIRIRVEGSGWCGILLMQGKTSEKTPSSEFIIAYDAKNPLVSKNYLVVNQLKAGATVTCVRNGSVISMYIGGVKFFETSYAVDHTGDWFGVGHVDGNDANAKPEMSNTKFITGKEKVEEYLKTLQSDITWEQGGETYTNLAERMGDDAAEWTTTRGIDGEVYGQAEYWAVSVEVKFSSDWRSFEFIQGSKESIRLRFHSGGYFGVIRMKTKAESGSTADLYPTGDFTPAYPTKNETVVNKMKAGATITCVRYGNTIMMYADGVKFFQTAYAVDHTNNWFGVGYVNADSALKPDMSNTKFITGQANVGAYLSSLTAKK